MDMTLVDWLEENFSADEREAILARHEVQTAQLIASISELVAQARETIDDFWCISADEPIS
jgi:hypothetical protein